jgi:DNA-directed RNA polymerase specialized sigma24 family protein
MTGMADEGGSHGADARVDGDAPALDTVGDQVALSLSFEDFYEIEHGRLFGALALITGNRHEAEELMQEAFLKLWERWHLVQSLASPTGYLYRTAMNVFRMRRRRALVASRRPRQRAAVVLTELLDFSSSEAAGSLGVKPATVRKLAQQGREALRKALQGSGEEGEAP